MNSYAVKEIESDSFFSKPVYLNEAEQQAAFVITAPEMPFTEELINLLDKWKFNTVISEGEPRKDFNASKKPEETESTAVIDEENLAAFSQQQDSEKLENAIKFYANFIAFVEKIFIKASISNELEFKEVTEKIRDTIEYIKEDRRFLMRVLKNIEAAEDKNYLAIHSVRSTIIAIIIGTYIKLPNHRLIDLGVAALMHEAGMLKLPQNIYLSQRALTPAEQKAIISHPILGYSLLKSLDFPLAICLAALEHHERENATGYPRRLTSDKISLYSKIIAVACSYEALSSKRPHKEAKDGYTGMLELLKNEGKQYDETIVRALVLSLSIYPIGLYVLLSNGKKGQVVDINPENPRFPIVQIFGEVTPDGKVKTMQTKANVLTIVRPLNKTEINN
ncbi:MAG: HD-GYP domain-containing protein [Treponema sp.]|nr:HD-GYP domain-containing protein [Treponema sp.]MCL2250562.1 HD-GYP domain-containing protein [Treponema sp.]